MKLAWILLTAMLLCAVAYLGRQQSTLAKERPQTSGTNSAATHRLAASMQSKLDHIQTNASLPQPDPAPTVMTEEEINDYLASGRVKLPTGVKKATLAGKSGIVNAFVNVDFDEIRAGQRNSNPLLSIFSGKHMVNLEADAAGSGGQGKVHVRSVSIDGVEVPRMALEFFVEKYITPKYPNIGIDSSFQMPDRIDLATVGYHKLTVVQK